MQEASEKEDFSLHNKIEGSQTQIIPLNDNVHITVLDWDDTLLASTYLDLKGLTLSSTAEEMKPFLGELDLLQTQVIAILSWALKISLKVFVITNAENGWVQKSCDKFMLRVLPLLKNISVVSARSLYESRYEDDPISWKFYAFKSELIPCVKMQRALKKKCCLFQMGDADIERNAIFSLKKECPGVIIKSIKFATKPTILQLERQLQLVFNHRDYVYSRKEDVDLMLTITNHSASTQNNISEHIPNKEITASAS